jgi:hypothetical protein
MTTRIEEYELKKRAQQESEQWAAMMGKEYHGGRGGHGKLVKLLIMKGAQSPEIYYQESNGSKNYHEIPDDLIAHLETAIKNNFVFLLDRALELQSEELKRIAGLAVIEHKELLAAAGIVV